MTDIPVGRELWSDLLRQIARRTRRNRADAEDLLHSAYLRLERYRTQNTVNDPAAFLVRTAFNISIDDYRHAKIQQNQAETPEVEDAAPLQDEVVAARARLARVKAGLNKLTPRTREIFLMHRLNNLKYHEIDRQRLAHFHRRLSAAHARHDAGRAEIAARRLYRYWRCDPSAAGIRRLFGPQHFDLRQLHRQRHARRGCRQSAQSGCPAHAGSVQRPARGGFRAQRRCGSFDHAHQSGATRRRGDGRRFGGMGFRRGGRCRQCHLEQTL